MHTKFFKLTTICITFVWLGCTDKTQEDPKEKTAETPLFSLVDSATSNITFTNVVENQKDFNIFKYRNFYNGGGVAIGDINNDGLADIYLTANMGKNKLYLNKGNMVFEDISASAGVEGNKPWSTGVVMADVNADGLLDIYVSNAGNMEGENHNNDLYINNGDLTFTEKAKEYNLAETGFTTQATFFDYDKDGDLDAYILNNSNIPVSSLGFAHQRNVRAQDWNVPKMFRGVGDMLLRNDGNTFTDVSEKAGIYGSLIGFGLGVMVSDVNNDLWPDIYVSNDFYERDYLYINNHDGTFTEDIKNWTSHLCLSAMGIDMADINNDGNADIFITDMLPDGDERVKSVMEFEGYNVFNLKQSKDFYQQYIQNTLQLNNGNGSYSEIAYFSGLSATDWSWSGLIFDMDNDGFRDIYVTNGINHDLTDLDFVDFFANDIIQDMALTGRKEAIDSIIAKMPVVPVPNYAFKNNHDLTFKNMAGPWGLGVPSLSNGAAYGDLDNDGDLDIVVNNVNMEAFVYENHTDQLNGYNYIKLKFEGSEKNPFAVGTKVKMYYDTNVVMQELIPSRGFQSSMEYPMTIGLGNSSMIDSIRVIWPDAKTAKISNVPVNQTLTLVYRDAQETYKIPKRETHKTFLSELPNNQLTKHEENTYNDFDYEGLIAKKVSQEGPCLAIGDLNGDGNEDVFVGGAKNQEGSLFMHHGNGSLTLKKDTAISKDSSFEDTAAAFFDADGDGDLDLMVGSGGNQVDEMERESVRLYLNDGKGNFSKGTLPNLTNTYNISAIAPQDVDQDGDLDVFIGSRSIVGVYGMDPKHFFLENQGNGVFVDASQKATAEVVASGMITDAKWINVDASPENELITVSDWGAPRVYKFEGGQLKRQASSLEELEGWWNIIYPVDIDGDGDQDLILGNQGKNLHYKPSKENYMKMWVNDFDNNGTFEQIVTQNLNGKDMPIHQKRELTTQMVSLKKQNLKASEYAKRSIQELFPESVLKNTTVKEVTTSETLLAINDGKGSFTTKALPSRTQLSCVCGITCSDVNNDGTMDIILGGNDYDFRPQFSRLDADYGSVLLNDGKEGFQWQDYEKTGFFIKEEIKHIQQFKDAQGRAYVIVAINNEKPRVYKMGE
ncbi:MAG TPA: VCBS repeat-containing protein [Flavobacteriaceae bacterium]|nr:VCBS repeat-containing protein [Flavobacteriaceae bacterium]MCB9213928.1 VCBS repeat-containing protein [Alteromonas sp.]HPF11087.1 VCBS repeat-containing protein [Flavobacteriaceae bacterium]HQU21245.1 VCBS repeat-containing protein [Flavobacteriaceae bacterium]HQU65717.1 VCBS repeat-containing protein [Flavobacteriaceae bacterium]